MTIDIALSNNFAFGGANASVLFARPGARADARRRRTSTVWSSPGSPR